MIWRSGERVNCRPLRLLSRKNRSAALIIALLLASHFAVAECGVVGKPEVPTFQPSSGYLRLTAHHDGQPASYALVKIGKHGATNSYLRLAADENGVVVSPRLPDGDFEVHALAGDGSAASLLIRVSGSATDMFSTFEMALHRDRFSPDVATEAANVQWFNGVVRDPTGTGIPRATVLVVAKKNSSASTVIEFSAGYDGKFATYLPNGDYVAFFSSSGFRMKIVHFVISSQGGETLLVRLNIGASC